MSSLCVKGASPFLALPPKLSTGDVVPYSSSSSSSRIVGIDLGFSGEGVGGAFGGWLWNLPLSCRRRRRSSLSCLMLWGLSVSEAVIVDAASSRAGEVRPKAEKRR